MFDTSDIEAIYDNFLTKGIEELSKLQQDTQMEDEHYANALSQVIVGAMANSFGAYETIKRGQLIDAQIASEGAKKLDIESATSVRDAQSAKDLEVKTAQIASEGAKKLDIESATSVRDAQSAKDLEVKTAQIASEGAKKLDIESATSVRDAQSAKDLEVKTAQIASEGAKKLNIEAETQYTATKKSVTEESRIDNLVIEATKAQLQHLATVGAGGLVPSANDFAAANALRSAVYARAQKQQLPDVTFTAGTTYVKA